MKEPSDFDPTILVGIRTTTRSDEFAVVQRTFLAQLGGVVMGVPEDVPHRQRQLLQQLWGDHIVGVTGDGELSSQKETTEATTSTANTHTTISPSSRLAPN